MRARACLAGIVFGAAITALVATDTARADAPAGHFTLDTGTGIVTDHKTGLLWQAVAVMPRRSLTDATNYCQVLFLGNTTGWRLPTIREALSLLDPSQIAPPLWDQSVFGVSGPGQVWSSTPDVSQAGHVWAIDTVFAGTTSEDPSSLQGVLCVH